MKDDVIIYEGAGAEILAPTHKTNILILRSRSGCDLFRALLYMQWHS